MKYQLTKQAWKDIGRNAGWLLAQENTEPPKTVDKSGFLDSLANLQEISSDTKED
ncbi:unnamed protein product, partial [marine sediment metagenome]